MGAYGPEADVSCACSKAVRVRLWQDRDGRTRCTICNGLVNAPASPPRAYFSDAAMQERADRAFAGLGEEDPADDREFREMRKLMRYGR
jgi:hypothetical protein